MPKTSSKKAGKFSTISQKLEHFGITPHEVIELFESLVENTWKDKDKELVHPGNSLDKRLFEAIARLGISVALEAVLFRTKGKKIEIFMTKRGLDESFPGEWYCPGSVFRPGEFPRNVVDRLAEKEFKAKISLESDCVADMFVKEIRGWFLSRVYLISATGKLTSKGKWFSVTTLPKDTITHHKNFVIPKALKKYKKLK